MKYEGFCIERESPGLICDYEFAKVTCIDSIMTLFI